MSSERSKSIKNGGQTFLGSGKKQKTQRIYYDESSPISPKPPGPKATLQNDIAQRQLSFLDVRNLETPEPDRPDSAVALFKPVTVEVTLAKQSKQPHRRGQLSPPVKSPRAAKPAKHAAANMRLLKVRVP